MDDGFDDLDQLDATGFAEALGSGEISIGEVQARTLRRIGNLDPEIGAIAELAEGPQPFDPLSLIHI